MNGREGIHVHGTWTFRTLDYSYREQCSYPPGLFVLGLFVPWTVRTMDYSYHHWTIRTAMQDSQKLTFSTKMCLCSVWVKPPWIFLTFSPNGILVQILFSNYTFQSTLDYKFLCNYLQLTKLCHNKRDHHHMLEMSTIGRNARWVVALNMV